MLSPGLEQLRLLYRSCSGSLNAQCCCRQHIREQHVEKELVSLLPAIGSDPTASKAGQALSKRMYAHALALA